MTPIGAVVAWTRAGRDANAMRPRHSGFARAAFTLKAQAVLARAVFLLTRAMFAGSCAGFLAGAVGSTGGTAKAAGWLPALAEPIDATPFDPPESRLYVSGLIASSQGDRAEGWRHASADGGSLVGWSGGDAAFGIALPRPGGWLRLELEGRSWDDLQVVTPDPIREGFHERLLIDPWSATVNLWRDVRLTDRISLYLGGGVGAGGHRHTSEFIAADRSESGLAEGRGRVGGVALQAGAGLAFSLHDRITVDLGYRFHTLQPTSGTAAATGSFRERAAGLASSEVLLSLRIYEPFRTWLR
jgi:opacity protein-like surface antigen